MFIKHKSNVSCSSDLDERLKKEKESLEKVRHREGMERQETQRGNPSTTSTASCRSCKQLGYAKPMRKIALIFEELNKL